jgi:glycosyltransferase involved in cell wall biosynthesis
MTNAVVDVYLARLRGEGVRVSLVIPTLNEVSNLCKLLPTLPDECELIIVDGGSEDGTLEVANALRPDAVVVRQSGRGKGDALLEGFGVSTGEIIVTFDADGSADPCEIPRFIDALVAGADFAKGSRMLEGGGSADLTVYRRLGNRFLGMCFNRLYGSDYTDLCYGYNALWRRALAFMPRTAAGFEIETQVHIWMARSQLKVEEVPSFEHRRVFGTSKLRPMRDGLRILRVIVEQRWSRTAAVDSGVVVLR